MKNKFLFILDGILAAVLLDISSSYEIAINYHQTNRTIFRLVLLALASFVFYFACRYMHSRRQLLFCLFLIGVPSYILSNVLLVLIRVIAPFSYFPVRTDLATGDGLGLLFGRLYLFIPLIIIKTGLFLFRFFKIKRHDPHDPRPTRKETSNPRKRLRPPTFGLH